MKMETRIRNEEQMKNFNHSTSQQLNNLASQPLNTSTSDGVAIRVEHVSKKYCKSLKRGMRYGVTDIGRNAFGLCSHSDRLRKDEFWAVDDVAFEVRKGETLGIIGPNGSGKTTLLKMLNGIFWPDKGKITIRGRVGALIAVGAGFHPLLTGRENIYINGAILGLSEKEIDDKLEEIIEFADIGNFIDSPVKFYSSGMFVRLGFSVAINIEPEVLLIDEILAVGDLSFRNKSLKRLAELREKAHAVVFVSHNMANIERLCDRVLYLNHGKAKFIGPAKETCSLYYESSTDDTLRKIKEKFGTKARYTQRGHTGDISIVDIRLLNNQGEETTTFYYGSDVHIVLELDVKKPVHAPQFTIAFEEPSNMNKIAHTTTLGKVENRPDFLPGRAQVECCLRNISLLRGIYIVDVGINSKEGLVPICDIKNVAQFTIVEPADNYQMVRSTGYFALPADWRFEGDNIKESSVL